METKGEEQKEEGRICWWTAQGIWTIYVSNMIEGDHQIMYVGV